MKCSIQKIFFICFLFTFIMCDKNPSSSNNIFNLTDIDGYTYNTVTIGSQTWMAENLRVTHYNNGDPIPNITDNVEWGNLTTGAYCNYDNNIDSAEIYGKLYNWLAIIDNRKIAPEGWHVPTDWEWKILEMYLGIDSSCVDTVGFRGTDEANKLKEAGNTHWQGPNISHATNESGFTGLPGGYRYFDGYAYWQIGRYAHFWTSSIDTINYLTNPWYSPEINNDFAWIRSLCWNSSQVYRTSTDINNGFSVRCIKDTD